MSYAALWQSYAATEGATETSATDDPTPIPDGHVRLEVTRTAPGGGTHVSFITGDPAFIVGVVDSELANPYVRRILLTRDYVQPSTDKEVRR